MNKTQYTHIYRYHRLLRAWEWDKHYGVITHEQLRMLKKQAAEMLGVKQADFLEVQRVYKNMLDSEKRFITAYSEKIYSYNPEHTPEQNSRINKRLFRNRLSEIYEKGKLS